MSDEKDRQYFSESKSDQADSSIAEKKEFDSKELVEKIEEYFYTDDGMYVCMYVCMYVRINVYKRLHVCVSIYVCIYVCIAYSL